MGYIAIVLACVSVTGCVAEGSVMEAQMKSEKRRVIAEADIAESRAKIVKQYQQCLERYENDPEKLKSVCVVYNQALLQLDVKGTK